VSKDKGKKKHVFKDQTSGIMDLVQTPNAYTAWTPPSKSDQAVADSAKSQLLAAEKAFDGAGDDAAASFLQLAQAAAAPVHQAASPPPAATSKALASPATASRRPVAGPKHKKPLSLLARASSTAVRRAKARNEGETEDVAGDRTQTVAAQAASVVLERYARSLDSAALLRLSRAKLSTGRLRALWRRVHAAALKRANASSATGVSLDGLGAREQQAAKWCLDFSKDTDARAREAWATQAKEAEERGEAGAHHRVLEREVKVRKVVLEVLGRGSESLQELRARKRREATHLDSLFKAMHFEALKASGVDGKVAEATAPLAGGELLGLAEGTAAASGDELEDLVAAAAGRLASALGEQQQGLKEAEGKLAKLKQWEAAQQAAQQASLLQQGSSTDAVPGEVLDNTGPFANMEEGSSAGGAMRERYGQMCKWTLEGIEARQHREEGERDALRAALAVLSAR